MQGWNVDKLLLGKYMVGLHAIRMVVLLFKPSASTSEEAQSLGTIRYHWQCCGMVLWLVCNELRYGRKSWSDRAHNWHRPGNKGSVIHVLHNGPRLLHAWIGLPGQWSHYGTIRRYKRISMYLGI